METSAKTAMNVNELFLAIGEMFTLFIYLNYHGLLFFIYLFVKDLYFFLCCSKKDAQNRHPEPDPRGATSRRQPPGPGRSLHPSLLRGELDGCTRLHLPPLTPSLFSCKLLHRGGPDPPAPRMLHLPSCPSNNTNPKDSREQLELEDRDSHLEMTSKKPEMVRRKCRMTDCGKPVEVFRTNCVPVILPPVESQSSTCGQEGLKRQTKTTVVFFCSLLLCLVPDVNIAHCGG